MENNPFHHIPVLAEEVCSIVGKSTVKRIIDGTLGGGGHSGLLLKALPEAELMGIDRDEEALAAATANLVWAGNRFHPVHGTYSAMKELAAGIGWQSVDAILLDIGVSSHQIDTPERGFSWRFDGPLDMRMDRNSPLTASRILNRWPVEELAEIFRNYGEIKQSRRLAEAVAERREKVPYTTTGEFAETVEAVLGRRKNGPPVPTLAFQALRIAVNDELGELRRGLETAVSLLNPGGILCVISFHSLEDRIVKDFIRLGQAECVCPPGLPVCCCGKVRTLRAITRKVVTPGSTELSSNRRSAPSRLRAAEKV